MDRKNMIDAIYDKIADKKISIWCKYLFWWDVFQICSHIIRNFSDWSRLIWQPISLARILPYLWEKSAKNYLTSYETTWMAKVETEYDDSFEWILIKDWTDAMLDDQSDNTIKTIYDLLFS